MSNIKVLMKQYEEVNAELNRQIAANGKEFIAEVFSEIFSKHEGLKLVVIQGWTPGFNDGEPCTHFQETFVGRDSWGEYLDFEDYEEAAESFEYDEETGEHINSGCSTLQTAYDEIEVYSELIERVFYTNFIVTISLDEEGEVVVNEDEYCCGY